MCKKIIILWFTHIISSLWLFYKLASKMFQVCDRNRNVAAGASESGHPKYYSD